MQETRKNIKYETNNGNSVKIGSISCESVISEKSQDEISSDKPRMAGVGVACKAYNTHRAPLFFYFFFEKQYVP